MGLSRQEEGKFLRRAAVDGVTVAEKNSEIPDRKLCVGCGRNDVTPKLCSSCLSAQYCSLECQRGCWRDHKVLCKTIRDMTEREEGRKREEDRRYISSQLRGVVYELGPRTKKKLVTLATGGATHS